VLGSQAGLATREGMPPGRIIIDDVIPMRDEIHCVGSF